MISLVAAPSDAREDGGQRPQPVAHPRHRLSSPWMIRLAYAALAAVVALVSVVTYETWQRASDWDPLGEYPVQTLLNADGTSPIGVPTYYLDDEITVQGKKCNAAASPVRISGTMSWISDQPPGTIITLGNSAGVRQPGCSQMTYSNPIPKPVLERVMQLTKQGQTQSVWHMAGVETPEREEGLGERRSWVTPSFIVVHRKRGT